MRWLRAISRSRGRRPAKPTNTVLPDGTYLSDVFYNDPVAFRGAMGYGANATGGRGNGTVGDTTLYFVDNLNDSGTGSLRAALEATGKRVIVPRVSGYVPLATRIEPTGNYTFLGQLAPGGFGVKPDSLPKDLSGYWRVSGSTAGNVIVRYVTIRSGETTSGYTSNDCLRISSGATDVIIDHVSMSYANDELLEVGSGADRVTLQNCLLAYPIEGSGSGHPESNHAYAWLLWGAGQTTMARSLISSVRERVPEAYGTTKVQFIGNVLYNYMVGALSFVFTAGELTPMDMVRNTFKPGPATGSVKDLRFRNFTTTLGQRNLTYLEGNVSQYIADSTDITQQKNMAYVLSPTQATGDGTDITEWVVETSVGTPELPMFDTAALFYAEVLTDAGNSLYRDSIDARAISEANSDGTGGSATMYSTAAGAGGFPALPTGTLPTATDGAISDAWRTANSETRNWYELDTGGTGRMIIENYADDVADGIWVEP